MGGQINLKRTDLVRTLPFGLNAYVIFLITFLYKSVITGLVYALQALMPLFRTVQTYEYLCEADQINELGCEAQNDALRAAWEKGFTAQLLSGIIFGPIIDRFGARLTATFGMVGGAVGILFWLMLGTQMDMSDDILILSWIVIGLVKQGIANSCFSVANIFPNATATAMSIINGATDIGAFIPQVFGFLMVNYGMRFPTVVKIYVTAIVVLIFLGLLILPKTAYAIGAGSTEIERQETEALIDRPSTSNVYFVESTEPDLWSRSFAYQLTTPYYWAMFLFFSVSYFRVAFYTSHLDTFLKAMDATQTPWYVAVFSTMVPFAALCAVVNGKLTDMFGIPFQLIFLNTVALCMYFIQSLNWIPLQLVSFLLYIIYKSNIMGILMFFLADTFGMNHFGKLAGVQTSLSAIVLNLMNWGGKRLLHMEPFRSNVALFNWVLIVLSLPLYAVPAYLMMYSPHNKAITKAAQEAGQEHRIRVSVIPSEYVFSRATLQIIEDCQPSFYHEVLQESKRRFSANTAV